MLEILESLSFAFEVFSECLRVLTELEKGKLRNWTASTLRQLG